MLLVAMVATVGVRSPAVVGAGPERAELHRDGDVVFYAAKAGGASAPTAIGSGYATYGDASLLEHYDIRLVDSPGVERLRPHLDAVADTMRGQVGESVSVTGPTVPAGSTRTGQIDVHVSSTAPCSGQWLGCATPIINGGQVVYAEVWIQPRMLERSAASLDNVVRHEMGHAFGLAHYDDAHEGQVQTMHSTSFAATSFRTGDLTGLRAVAVHASPTEPRPQPSPRPAPVAAADPAPVPDPAPAPAPAPPPAGDPTGIATVQATSVVIVVRGHAVDPDSNDPVTVSIVVDDDVPIEVEASGHDPAVGDHGFEAVWAAEPGTRTVCVVARNVGGGADTSLGCHEVVVATGGIGRRGLQTL